MIPQVGQRWHWIYTGRIYQADLVVEIVADDGIFVRGQCVQVIHSNDSYDKPGRIQGTVLLQCAYNDSSTIIIDPENHGTLTYLPGQDRPI